MIVHGLLRSFYILGSYLSQYFRASSHLRSSDDVSNEMYSIIIKHTKGSTSKRITNGNGLSDGGSVSKGGINLLYDPKKLSV